MTKEKNRRIEEGDLYIKLEDDIPEDKYDEEVHGTEEAKAIELMIVEIIKDRKVLFRKAKLHLHGVCTKLSIIRHLLKTRRVLLKEGFKVDSADTIKLEKFEKELNNGKVSRMLDDEETDILLCQEFLIGEIINFYQKKKNGL